MTSCLSTWKSGVFPDKMCSDRRKNMVVDRKNQKALALLYLALKPLRNAANSSGVLTKFATEQQGKFELFTWTLSPNFFRLNWTFCLPPKRQLSTLLNFFFPLAFFPLTNLFLSLFVLLQRGSPCDFTSKTRDTAQGYTKCLPHHIGDPVMPTDGRMDGRTSHDYYVTTIISWLDRWPNLLANGAPLAC